jgi:hypothetical protein
MLQLDATQLYDLSEAGRLLCRDPVRLAREAKLRQIPSARVERRVGLPIPWVDAEAGESASDPESLRTYWLARLEPPSPDARRPLRDRARLPAADLLEPAETAAAIFATPAALRRLSAEGTLPALRVDGRACYDAELIALFAAGDSAAEARRSEVAGWARFEYATDATSAPPAPPREADRPTAAETTGPVDDPGPGPGAYEIPADLDLEGIDPMPQGPRLIEAEGFETVDEE